MSSLEHTWNSRFVHELQYNLVLGFIQQCFLAVLSVYPHDKLGVSERVFSVDVVGHAAEVVAEHRNELRGYGQGIDRNKRSFDIFKMSYSTSLYLTFLMCLVTRVRSRMEACGIHVFEKRITLQFCFESTSVQNRLLLVPTYQGRNCFFSSFLKERPRGLGTAPDFQ